MSCFYLLERTIWSIILLFSPIVEHTSFFIFTNLILSLILMIFQLLSAVGLLGFTAGEAITGSSILLINAARGK